MKDTSSKRPDGVTLRGWLLPALDAAPFVPIFRGENETTADAHSHARGEFVSAAPNLNVVCFDYRGTGHDAKAKPQEIARFTEPSF